MNDTLIEPEVWIEYLRTENVPIDDITVKVNNDFVAYENNIPWRTRIDPETGEKVFEYLM
jgi:hypothetical protein